MTMQRLPTISCRKQDPRCMVRGIILKSRWSTYITIKDNEPVSKAEPRLRVRKGSANKSGCLRTGEHTIRARKLARLNLIICNYSKYARSKEPFKLFFKPIVSTRIRATERPLLFGSMNRERTGI